MDQWFCDVTILKPSWPFLRDLQCRSPPCHLHVTIWDIYNIQDCAQHQIGGTPHSCLELHFNTFQESSKRELRFCLTWSSFLVICLMDCGVCYQGQWSVLTHVIFLFSHIFYWPWNEPSSHHQKTWWHLYSPQTKGVTALTDESGSENEFQCVPTTTTKKHQPFTRICGSYKSKYLHYQADPEMSDTRIGKSVMLCFCFCFCFLYLFPADLSDGSMSHLDRNARHQRSMRRISFWVFFCRFNEKVKHIKILTKDGCFYIAESRLFKTVLVRYFYTCRNVDCKHLDVILYSNRTTRASGNFGCTIFIGLSLFCFCDTLANWISYVDTS